MGAMRALTEMHAERMQVAALKESLAIASEMLEATTAYKHVQELRAQIKAHDATMVLLRADIDKEALRIYGITSDKQPLPAVSIRVGKLVKYDELKAREWCLHNMTTALTLDTRTFDSNMLLIHKKKAAVSPLPEFVTVVDDPIVTLASDLSAAVKDINIIDSGREFPKGEFAPESPES